MLSFWCECVAETATREIQSRGLEERDGTWEGKGFAI